MMSDILSAQTVPVLLKQHGIQQGSDSKRYADALLTWDVLSGSDKRFDKHPGNMRYKQILNKMRPGYTSTESKTAKKKMVGDIDEFIQSYGGRFLRIDESNGRFRLLRKAESRNKISRSLRENAPQQESRRDYITKISELDVMCGRGGKANHHLGNKLYRNLVTESKEAYRNTQDKDEKTDLSRSIVDHVLSYRGRFVKKDASTGRYYILTKAEARTKTSQALRENRGDFRNTSRSDIDSYVDESSMLNESDMEEDAHSIGDNSADLDKDSLDCCKALMSLGRVGTSGSSLAVTRSLYASA